MGFFFFFLMQVSTPREKNRAVRRAVLPSSSERMSRGNRPTHLGSFYSPSYLLWLQSHREIRPKMPSCPYLGCQHERMLQGTGPVTFAFQAATLPGAEPASLPLRSQPEPPLPRRDHVDCFCQGQVAGRKYSPTLCIHVCLRGCPLLTA